MLATELARDRTRPEILLGRPDPRARSSESGGSPPCIRYVDDAGIDDVIAPFEVLAAGSTDGGTTFANRPHTWHLDTADGLALAGPGIFASTQRLLVSTWRGVIVC